jgi:hypothetical protein
MSVDVMTEQFAHAIVAVIQHDYDTFADAALIATKDGPGTPEENAASFRRSLAGRRPTGTRPNGDSA